VLIKPTSGQDIASIYVKVKAGLSSENEYAGAGITHYIEHMIFKGSPEIGVGELARKVRSYGGQINASTSPDTTTFYITVPIEYLPNCIELLADAIMNPVFEKKELEKERDVILNELRMYEDDPSRRISKILFETAYIRNSYRFPVIGYESLFKKLTRDDLVSYHRKFYVPNNMVVAIAGRIDPVQVLKDVEKNFGGYSRKFDPIPFLQNEPEQIQQRVARRFADINLGYLAIGYHSTGLLDSDLFPMDVLALILGQGKGSRIYQRVVKEKELMYSLTCHNYTPLYPGIFVIEGIGDPDKLDDTVEAIQNEIEEIKDNGVTDKEFEKAKALALTGYLKSLETVNSQAGSMAEGQVFAGDPEFSRQYVKGIEQVTEEDVVRVAEAYLRDANSSVVYLLPRTMENGETGEGIGKKPNADNSTAKKYELDNGLRIIIKEEHSLPLVSLVCAYLGGLRAEPEGLNGMCSLTGNLLLKGTRTKNESEIIPEVENKGGSMSSYSGLNTFGISMEFLSRDTDFALSLLEDVIKNSIIPEEELRKLKEKVIAAIVMQDDNIFAKGPNELRKGIFRGHPYGNRTSGEVNTIEEISREDILAFYVQSLNPEQMVISVVGDVDSDQVIAELTRRFSDVATIKSNITTDKVGPLDEAEEIVIHMPKEEALYLIGFYGVDVKNEERYMLDVIFRIMGGHGGRLFEAIRESFGFSYTQGGGSVAGIDPGYCFFYVVSDENNIEKAKDILLDEINRLRSEPVSDEELEGAKNSLKGSFMIAMQTNNSKAFIIATDELYSLGYDSYLLYNSRIDGCTKKDILRVAEEYLDPERSFSVTVLPESEGE